MNNQALREVIELLHQSTLLYWNSTELTLHTSAAFSKLMTFANNLDPDQALGFVLFGKQNIWPYLRSKLYDTQIITVYQQKLWIEIIISKDFKRKLN